MGRRSSPPYRVEFGRALAARDGRLVAVTLTPAGFRGSADALARYVEGIADQNGLNIGSARLIRQRDGEVIAEYRAPLFRVIGEVRA
jgi:hypothetical protein